MTIDEINCKILQIKERPAPIIYSRITGYYRAVENFNDAKLAEYNDRKMLQI